MPGVDEKDASDGTPAEQERRRQRAALIAGRLEARALVERLAPRRTRLARARELLHRRLLRF